MSDSSIETSGYDRKVVAASLSGDREAFSGLVKKYQKKAYAIARAILGVHEDAEDAVQDAFLQAYEKLNTFDARLSFGPWISTIVSNKARDIARKGKVRGSEELDEELLSAEDRFARESLWDPAESFELSDKLGQALVRLSETQRIVVIMYAQGFTHAEIAESLGIPNGTSRSELFQARNRLRSVLEQEYMLR